MRSLTEACNFMKTKATTDTSDELICGLTRQTHLRP